jgi:hypothetical protein
LKIGRNSLMVKGIAIYIYRISFNIYSKRVNSKPHIITLI